MVAHWGQTYSKTIKEALDFDRNDGNTFWADAIAKEMKNIWEASDRKIKWPQPCISLRAENPFPLE